jgi:hypothetical protein
LFVFVYLHQTQTQRSFPYLTKRLDVAREDVEVVMVVCFFFFKRFVQVLTPIQNALHVISERVTALSAQVEAVKPNIKVRD